MAEGGRSAREACAAFEPDEYAKYAAPGRDEHTATSGCNALDNHPRRAGQFHRIVGGSCGSGSTQFIDAAIGEHIGGVFAQQHLRACRHQGIVFCGGRVLRGERAREARRAAAGTRPDQGVAALYRADGSAVDDTRQWHSKRYGRSTGCGNPTCERRTGTGHAHSCRDADLQRGGRVLTRRSDAR